VILDIVWALRGLPLAPLSSRGNPLDAVILHELSHAVQTASLALGTEVLPDAGATMNAVTLFMEYDNLLQQTLVIQSMLAGRPMMPVVIAAARDF
jgi:hypothetical protein